MTGPEAYREASLLLSSLDEDVHSPQEMALRASMAQAYATIALAAATVEAADRNAQAVTDPAHRQTPLVMRPTPADESTGDPAFPGSPWGRAIYGGAS